MRISCPTCQKWVIHACPNYWFSSDPLRGTLGNMVSEREIENSNTTLLHFFPLGLLHGLSLYSPCPQAFQRKNNKNQYSGYLSVHSITSHSSFLFLLHQSIHKLFFTFFFSLSVHLLFLFLAAAAASEAECIRKEMRFVTGPLRVA